MPRALLSGITGQDGSYLAEALLADGYEVHGLVRPHGDLATSRIGHLIRDPAIHGQRLFLHHADLAEPAALRRALLATQPDELYHLAGPSHVGQSFELPESTCHAVAFGALRWLEMLRDLPRPPRFFQATSAEIFGRPARAPQDEETPSAPVTPYGCAMAFARHLVGVYRATHGLFACCGILYNHESPRRGESFVTRKICRAAAAIRQGHQRELLLGDLEAARDWGHARDYVQAMRLMLRHREPADYVLATGQLHTVRDVLDVAFGVVGLDWQHHVKSDPRLLRPAEPARLVGNPAKARRDLGWSPTTSFADLIREMTEAEVRALAGSRPSAG
jgi:GDPmannose 4,6-dehydratase